MTDPAKRDPEAERMAQEAAEWVLRCDRGLTAREQDEYSDWLASDPRHAVALKRFRSHWQRLDTMADWRPQHAARPNPDLLAPPPPRRIRRLLPWAVSLAAAAAIVLLAARRSTPRAEPMVAPSAVETAVVMKPIAPPAGQRVLEDGSIVDVNAGATFTAEFTPQERRIRLDHGEAHFVVAKDPGRPFIVTAHGVDVRAVGTVFNVKIDPAAVEVLVAEGRVQLTSTRQADPTAPANASEAARPAPAAVPLEARQRAVVPLAAGGEAPQVSTLPADEIARALAWQHRLLDFTAVPLSDIVAEFNRRNVVQLVVADPELAAMRMSAAIRSDNVEGFVHLIEVGFGAQAERHGESEIVLRKRR